MTDLLNSSVGQLVVVAVVAGLVWGFFRKLIVPIVLVLAAQIALFVFVPGLLLSFVNLVSMARSIFR